MKNKALGVLFVCGGLIFSSCKKEYNDPQPVLSTSPVDISHVKQMVAFGQQLKPNKFSPAFEYIADNPNVAVFAINEGYVDAIEQDLNFKDYEIRIKPNKNSAWTIIYDHILSPVVSIGSPIKNGTKLGRVGAGNRTELQINKFENNHSLAICPFEIASQNFIDLHNKINKTWCLQKTVEP